MAVRLETQVTFACDQCGKEKVFNFKEDSLYAGGEEIADAALDRLEDDEQWVCFDDLTHFCSEKCFEKWERG